MDIDPHGFREFEFREFEFREFEFREFEFRGFEFREFEFRGFRGFREFRDWLEVANVPLLYSGEVPSQRLLAVPLLLRSGSGGVARGHAD